MAQKTIITIKDSFDTKRKVLDDFGKSPITFGRSSECDIVLQNGKVSKTHGCFYKESNGSWYVQDMMSTNGTLVNNIRITDGVRLNNGDTIVLDNRMKDDSVKMSVALEQAQVYDGATSRTEDGAYYNYNQNNGGYGNGGYGNGGYGNSDYGNDGYGNANPLTKDGTHVLAPLGMKWHYFLCCFALWAGGILSIILAISELSELNSLNKATFGLLDIAGVGSMITFYYVVVMITGVLDFVVAILLLMRKKAGPVLLFVIYLIGAVNNLVVCIWLSSKFGSLASTLVGEFVFTIIVQLVFLGINAYYYNNRKALFK